MLIFFDASLRSSHHLVFLFLGPRECIQLKEKGANTRKPIGAAAVTSIITSAMYGPWAFNAAFQAFDIVFQASSVVPQASDSGSSASTHLR